MDDLQEEIVKNNIVLKKVLNNISCFFLLHGLTYSISLNAWVDFRTNREGHKIRKKKNLFSPVISKRKLSIAAWRDILVLPRKVQIRYLAYKGFPHI